MTTSTYPPPTLPTARSFCGVCVAIREEAKRVLGNDPSLAEVRLRAELEWATLVVGALFRGSTDERTSLLRVAALCALRIEALEHTAQTHAGREPPRARRAPVGEAPKSRPRGAAS